MARGTIKNLVSDRGFGFILPEQALADGKDLFFHRSDVANPGYDGLRVGQQVDYDLGKDERRGTPKAFNVRAAASA
jgi:cold shock CspA family protein